MSPENTLTPEQLAEQAGHQISFAALAAMRNTPHQAARLAVLSDALGDVCNATSGREAALRGFAVGLIATLDAGLGV